MPRMRGIVSSQQRLCRFAKSNRATEQLDCLIASVTLALLPLTEVSMLSVPKSISPIANTALALLIGALLGGAFAHHVTASIAQGAAANAALAAERANALALDAAQTRLRNAERVAHQGLKIEQHYQKELVHARATHQTLRDQLRSGALRMRVPGLANACAANASTASAATAASADAAASSELPSAVASDLADLAADANQTALALAACQRYLQHQWHTVNSYADAVEQHGHVNQGGQ